jgi:colanic acid/amylovoran biosynthesis glycosyltransferase
VIASDVSGIPDVIDNEVTGFLVRSGDEEALAQRLRWVFENPVDAAEVGLHARESVQRVFSTERYVDNYRQVMEAANVVISGNSEHAPAAFQSRN